MHLWLNRPLWGIHWPPLTRNNSSRGTLLQLRQTAEVEKQCLALWKRQILKRNITINKEQLFSNNRSLKSALYYQ